VTRLTAGDFPAGTPLRHFFEWAERRWFHNRRYRLMRDVSRLPVPLAAAVKAAIGNPDIAAHAAVIAAFEEAAVPGGARSGNILVIRLSAFGDFVQALGPFAAIRRRHAEAHISLLTTRAFADFARELGFFNEIMIDERPGPAALPGWLALRRRLRAGRFARVYDLQTSTRSSLYAWLLRPGMPQWSGIAWHCSHPHANLDRDRQHTLDEQAEQLLMAGIFPTPLPALPPLDRVLPAALAGRDFVLLVPGSSPQRPEKRWPAEYFGTVARALAAERYIPVVVGTPSEAPLATLIRDVCPVAIDLVGQTDLSLLGVLAGAARLTIGNDTGVCHLAAAAGCPVIVLFSAASDPERCAPRGRLVRVLTEADLGHLDPKAVLAAANDILASVPASGAAYDTAPVAQPSGD
jgi:ADP-heptose:LPS heptosyltransferase